MTKESPAEECALKFTNSTETTRHINAHVDWNADAGGGLRLTDDPRSLVLFGYRAGWNAHEASECRIKSYVTTEYHDAVVAKGQRRIHALELENAQMVGPGVVVNLEAKVETLESRIAAALEIADGMCSMDRHYGMTIEGRGEVIRAVLSGTAVDAVEGKN